MKYLVEALDTYEKHNITDNDLKRVPKVGERFEVNKERLDILLGQNSYNVPFVKLIEQIDTKEIKTETINPKKVEKAIIKKNGKSK